MLNSVLRTSLTGVHATGIAIRTSANNVANAQTDGFQASRVVFAEQIPGRLKAENQNAGGAVQVASILRDQTIGTILLDRDPLQMAIEGNAYFALQTGSGERVYSQNARLRLDADGQLVDPSGARVLGNNVDSNFTLDRSQIEILQLPIARSPAPNARLIGFEVNENGEIHGNYSDGESRIIGQIRKARFANPSNLRELPATRFSEGLGSGVATFPSDTSSRIISGARRVSNTDIARDLVSLSKSAVMFRANLQVLETSEELLESLYGLGRR